MQTSGLITLIPSLGPTADGLLVDLGSSEPMARETLAIFQQIEQTVNTVFLAQKYQLLAN